MKIPKQITINGRKIKVKQKKMNGGSFNWWDHEIIIASNVCKDLQEEILLHEIVEYIMVDMDLRYSLQLDNSNGDYLFSFSHQQYVIFIKSLHAALNSYQY